MSPAAGHRPGAGRRKGTIPSILAWKERVRPYYLKYFYFRLAPARKPAYFDACWQCPAVAPSEAARAPRGEAGDVIILPQTDWHTRIQRTQQLAIALEQTGYRLFYVNPHLGRQFPRPHVRREELKVTRLGERIFEVHIHLPREPVYHHRLLRPEESRQIAEALEEVGRRFGVGEALQLVSFPVWLEAARRLRRKAGWAIVYDCHDLLGGFPEAAPSLVEEERLGLRACDAVVASSAELARWVAAECGPELETLTLRNGVEPGRFNFRAEREPQRTTVGYVGAIESWFAAPMVAAAARRHPELRFLLGGRVETDSVRPLRDLPNVEFAGEVDFAHLPAFLERVDVGLIPFHLTLLTRAADPIKVYEYFACGMPVASSRLPELERFGELIYRGDTPEEFAAAVGTAVEEQDPARRRARREWAERESWAARAQALSNLFERLKRRVG